MQGVIQPKGFPGLPEGWTTEWETYPSADSQVLLFASIFRKKEPQVGMGHRALVISHGIGEHGGRYLHFPHYLKKSLDLVFCPDHRGHGRSEGLRGHVARFRDFADDLAHGIRRLDEQLKARYGRSEIHVMGHSMGSLVLLGALGQYADLPIRSACVSSPLVGLKMGVPIVKKTAAIALSRLWGSLQMESKLDASLLSRDQEVIDAYIRDRLVHPKITPRLFMEMQTAMQELVKQDHPFQYPLQMIVPMDDQIVDPEAALNFYRELKIHDKELKTYPGFYHESFNDPGKEQVFEDFEAWIRRHSETGA